MDMLIDTREGEKDLYRLARQRDRDGKDVQHVRVIKDRDGRVLTSEESVQRRWKEYFEELMNEENEREKRVEGVNSVEQKVDKIRKDEVRKALKRMKSGKAVGPDDIPVEVWKCLGEAAVEFLASLFNRVLESEKMPEEWRRSVLVPIFKNKGDVQSCSNYRGIKLMSYTMKVWERVVEARLRKVVEICEQQYGFMPRKSTTDAIFALRILRERYRDGQRELHCVFVDLEKAYDRVPREELWYCMRKSGVAEKYVFRLCRTVMRCAVSQTEEFKVEVGLHQGSALSPFLFAIVMDQLSEEVRQESPWTMMKVYRTVGRPAMLYGLETVSLRKRLESELEVAELKMLRFSLGVTRLDRIRNEYIRGTAHVGCLGDKDREARLRWFGHVQRKESEHNEFLKQASSEASFYKEKLETSAQDPRKLHNIFSSLLNPPAPPSPSSLTAEDFASFYTEKIERICQTFTSLPTSPTSHNQHSTTPSLTQLSTVAAEEVLQITRSCNPTTCPLDPIPSAMLQTISPDLLPFITTVINGSLTSGHVPTAFKKARVIPILKKPALDTSDISNYRPVSLLSFLSKILERVVCNQLSDYLMQNNLHDPNQSGFKAAHSTETALLAVTEKLHSARSAKLSSVLILLDLSAAFDTVNHKTLLSTLRSLGICGTAWEWFASYLDGRSYQVTWKGLTSAPCRLSTGVPQGSVLGPLLFSLYTHSLGKVISSHGFSYHCYADDTQLIFSFPPSDTTTSARISACLADISSWMTAHQLKLNPSKTELLIIPGDPSPAQDLAISLSNSMISPTASARNLGVTMDNQLSFSSHVTNVTRSCRFLLYNIRRIRPFLSTQATQVLVQSLVISRLDYCNSLLAGLPLNAIRPLQMIQNAAARLVSTCPSSPTPPHCCVPYTGFQ
ncbi:hypothetical protein QTP70_016449 [Hemibagrus guttatus]|uniref:Reverse transcriptase domain-containing protein n=1 Tax=Hemibagrus guttatus TaxID=175788 RepID=A0AAE0R9A4_9TELE|nr:hypothetical protein QTP70_016449 [Hemibagrus guttatus]